MIACLLFQRKTCVRDVISIYFSDTSQSVQEYHSAVQCKNLTGLSSLILSKCAYMFMVFLRVLEQWPKHTKSGYK